MAGLGRAQSKFGLQALFATLGSFLRLGMGSKQEKERLRTMGHPVLRKVLKGKMDGCPAGFHCTHRESCAHFTGRV